MKVKKESFFWTSYSDLMTSLFFIMLVLFVLVIILLHNRMEATETQLQAIKEVVNSTKDLKGDYFVYRDDYKKYILNISCPFPIDKYDINELSEYTKNDLLSAGKEITSFLNRHSDNQYIVIIEGQASKDRWEAMDHNYVLSFNRALALRKYWNDCGLDFGDNCEMQISGSGDGRLNVNSMREDSEELNQRFLIYILPKNIIDEE